MNLIECIETGRISDESKRKYTRVVRDFLAHAGDDPSGWTTRVVESWVAEVESVPGRSTETVCSYLYGLRYAARRRMRLSDGALSDFTEHVEMPKNSGGNGEQDRRAITAEQAQRLLDACDGVRPADFRDAAAVALSLGAGVRRTELLAIDLDEIELLDDGSGAFRYVAKGSKRKSARVPTWAMRRVAAWQEWLRVRGIDSGRMFRSFKVDANRSKVLLRSKLSGDGWRRILATRSKKAGIDPAVRPHELRNTHVTLALDSGVELWRVQKQVGHARVTQTIDYARDLTRRSVVEDVLR